MTTDDDADFSAYVVAHWSSLVRAARYLGCSAHDAEDLVQTALIRCYRSWARIRRADRVDAYVHRVLVTSYAKSRRRRWHGELPTDRLPEPDAGTSAVRGDARSDLHRALQSLSLDHRTVLVLRFITDLTEEQTAEVLGIPIGTVKSRVSRALSGIDRAALREETP